MIYLKNTTFLRELTLIIGVLKWVLTVLNWSLNHGLVILQTMCINAFELTPECHVAIIKFVLNEGFKHILSWKFESRVKNY